MCLSPFGAEHAAGTLLLSTILKKAVNIHKAKSANEAICQGTDGNALSQQEGLWYLSACSIEFVLGNHRFCVSELLLYSRERENRRKEETDLPSATALCAVRQRRRGGNMLQSGSTHGRFYRLPLPLYPRRRGVFGGFSGTSCSGFQSAFCFTF